ncbi:hypothetical protein A2U01_0066301, partial [Trifolium medium]|nr:hypothetical protein [Trifolium medium]
MGSWNGDIWTWKLLWIDELTDSEVETAAELLMLLQK